MKFTGKSALLFVFLMAAPWVLQAGKGVFKASHKVEYLVPFRKSPGNKDMWGNHLLKEMAKEVLREPWQVRIRITCSLNLSVEGEATSQQLSIVPGIPCITGDTVFRHFPVTGVLIPSRISMKLKWANRADTSAFTADSLVLKPFLYGDTIRCHVPVVSFDPQVDTLLVRDVELFYDSAALKTFLSHTELIHDYYASVLLLDSLNRFTADVRPGNYAMMPYHYLKIEELSSVANLIAARDFPGRLLKNGYDPAGLMKRYQDAFKHSRTLIFNFTDDLRVTGKIPWDRDVDRFAGCFTARVFSYVQRSYLMDQQQGKIYGDCPGHFFDQTAFPTEENVLPRLLAKIYPEAFPDTLPSFISRRIYASYLQTARRLMTEGNYSAAFSLLENGRQFTVRISGVAAITPDLMLQSEAAQGICNSYTGIALTCIEKNKFAMADIYLAKAHDYIVKNARFIRSDSAYRQVFSQLFFLRNTDCDQLLVQKRYAEALDCYSGFETIYSAADLAAVSEQLGAKKSAAKAGLGILVARASGDALRNRESDSALIRYDEALALRRYAPARESVDDRLDSLAPVMAKIRYDRAYREGEEALDKRQFTLAVTKFRDAELISTSNYIAPGTGFDSTFRRAMKFYLIVHLSSAQKKIWVSQFDSARIALEETVRRGKEYHLEDDPGFAEAMELFRQKIEAQQCRNLADSMELMMIRADRSRALGNYIKACDLLKAAFTFSQTGVSCGVDGTRISDSLAKIELPATFQVLEQKVINLLASAYYRDAIVTLQEIHSEFSREDLARFGLRREDTYEVIRERENPYLSFEAVSWFYEQKDYPEALRYLILSYGQGLPEEQSVTLQVSLAAALAMADFSSGQMVDASAHNSTLVPAASWFNPFRKGYLTQWANLKKKKQ